jgi:hypothetical protein
MTLENALRGSGDIGAFLCACWGTRLQDPANPYQSASYLENLKQRDFESQPFEVTCGPDCRLHIVADPAAASVTLASRRGNHAKKDGQDDVAAAMLKANPKWSERDAVRQLKDAGIKRSRDWVRQQRYEFRKQAGEVGESAA